MSRCYPWPMNRARLDAVCAAVCAALLFAATLDSHAAGFSGRGGSGGGAHVSGAHASHGGFAHGPHTTVVVRGGFGFYYGWPGPYYWPGYYYAPAYYYPAPVYYAAPAAEPPPPTAYWYYCAPLGAYYPYVQDCPAA